jgi:hypothetical protein
MQLCKGKETEIATGETRCFCYEVAAFRLQAAAVELLASVAEIADADATSTAPTESAESHPGLRETQLLHARLDETKTELRTVEGIFAAVTRHAALGRRGLCEMQASQVLLQHQGVHRCDVQQRQDGLGAYVQLTDACRSRIVLEQYSRRIAFVCFGSRGDFDPTLACASACQSRGYEVVVFANDEIGEMSVPAGVRVVCSGVKLGSFPRFVEGVEEVVFRPMLAFIERIRSELVAYEPGGVVFSGSMAVAPSVFPFRTMKLNLNGAHQEQTIGHAVFGRMLEGLQKLVSKDQPAHVSIDCWA